MCLYLSLPEPKEGTKPGPRPAVGEDEKSRLYTVPFVYKSDVVLTP